MKAKKRANLAVSYLVLIIISIIWLFPFVCLVLQSFRGYGAADGGGGMVNYLLPKRWTLDSYKYLFNGESKFLRWYMNTLIIAIAVTLVQSLVVVCVSYALSRMRFKGRKLLMNIWLVLGMFPGFLTMICLYFLLKSIGLTQEGAVPGLILIAAAGSGMGYYVCKGYFDTIPRSLDEAARIDGATRMQIMTILIAPLSKPIIIYQLLVAFMAPWCDYIFASYIAFGHSDSYNVAVALQKWVWTNDYQGYFTRFCAGGILVAIPVTILFMCLQRYYVEGVTGGAVKG
ncbi:arabinogalactan oligomer / maltooligosaccharide transport system permease protein [Eubacterium ruminantium]|uniref:Arabinogalactan oligomer / maltooligosaccharide transport system permease protein n=1 Tax=Eubacterium ruminantium TaxID=42322 RepID=A0A1T4PWV9_9FIRM|nr:MULTISPECIES: sugar ABC transporter permease [Eubacterium]MCR5369000.1 sugar ABC transporter permease [Eubacterium sp.]SCW62019.1 arabinogalactan oligomer / maltooligosaccharide transport system permease protein [Eubacterium ruminantium]SDN13757.1 maltooligosaccharide ABC transporter membrane protein [Eubacterium ruminantium]SJZ95428.1 arabinogalactan oligomer / maltooligosaccharide transport system permease protein [Eubacterium ruminantium]